MPDDNRQVATRRDGFYSLSIDDAALLYARAGHPRTPRSVQRYCAAGHLDAVKETTMLGDKYFINGDSVARHIAQIEELIALDGNVTGRDSSRPVATSHASQTADDKLRPLSATLPDMSLPVAQEIQRNSDATATDNARHSASEPRPPSPPVAETTPDVSRVVAGLEREVERALDDREFLREQIKTKDKQIEALLERDRETNILVRGLQQMLSPLLSPARRQPPEQGSQPTF